MVVGEVKVQGLGVGAGSCLLLQELQTQVEITVQVTDVNKTTGKK